MTKKKNYLLLTFLAMISLVLAACNFGGETSKDDDKGKDGGDKAKTKELNLVIPSEPPSMNPQLVTDSTSGALITSVFEGLTRLNKEAKAENAMAEDIKISKNKLTYTFRLRDAKWTNGDPVVAGDFEYAWKFALNPDNASEYATQLYYVKGGEAYNKGKGSADDVAVKAVDEKTLEVTLENPTPYFLELTSFYTYMPVNQKVAEANKDWSTEAGKDYVTNGPFTFDDWKHDTSVTLKKNADYWDAATVKLDQVNISMVEKEAVAVQKFKAGEIDYLGPPYQNVALDSIDEFKKNNTLNIMDVSSVYWYKLNTKGKFTKNANIRKALTLAMNRQDLIDNVTKGEQKPALGMIPGAIAGFEEDRGYYKDNDMEGAKAALEAGMKELGIKNASDIKIAISMNTSEAHAAVAQFIQEGWHKNLGINVTIDNAEWQVYLDKLSKLDYDVGRLGWNADYRDPYTFLEMFSTADNGNNDTGWENADYKALMKKSVAETDYEKRVDILKEAEGIAMKEFPVAPIYYYTNLSVKKESVKDMGPDPIANVQLKWVDITK
ncbi:peptide ABC transporter substrate-binding protein [Viridibacillus sp. YIM B01967]|uniref:Peptide ABC transporter substrate-binding protein n=1 Tax=Viridibacillus soli TaxID=2798301 RepID=A0ABS1H6X1_9BACL|nr:peptide ABC transporter substrate-binding protein [Viridibacillus soli]MBK3495163.1 peptide ABC transporter substrate-binding protein [Viridibacillus soli]